MPGSVSGCLRTELCTGHACVTLYLGSVLRALHRGCLCLYRKSACRALYRVPDRTVPSLSLQRSEAGVSDNTPSAPNLRSTVPNATARPERSNLRIILISFSSLLPLLATWHIFCPLV
ncbi:hypothetical protein NDU88_008302 [Pleurodeles waltl]|uniref:Uncharacterized protein n=1 Tax=Pleurodeles waltl TaxID=8319 RepID=A0AAV7PNR8_PLEWA|nr:hypothetical protein NDU88_008302 [Pleurodeles waltl]